MRTETYQARFGREDGGQRSFAVDTSFVLFFLAVEFGQSIGGFSLERLFLATTLVMVAFLPYFAMPGKKPAFGRWMLGRCLIMVLAFVSGIFFKQALGIIFPEEFRFVPMTLLIVAAIFSGFAQFHGFFKLRLAK